MPNIASIGGVLIASIASFGGNANIASVGGVNTSPGSGTLYVTGFHYFNGSEYVYGGIVSLDHEGIIDGYPVWYNGSNEMSVFMGSNWRFIFGSHPAFDGDIMQSLDDPTGVTNWTANTTFLNNGFTCYFLLP